MKNFLKKPITWGAYFKLCGVSMVLSALFTAFAWLNAFGLRRN